MLLSSRACRSLSCCSLACAAIHTVTRACSEPVAARAGAYSEHRAALQPAVTLPAATGCEAFLFVTWPDAWDLLQISDSSVQSIEVVPGAPRQTWTDLFDECASEASAPSHAASDASSALALAPAVSAQIPSKALTVTCSGTSLLELAGLGYQKMRAVACAVAWSCGLDMCASVQA